MIMSCYTWTILFGFIITLEIWRTSGYTVWKCPQFNDSSLEAVGVDGKYCLFVTSRPFSWRSAEAHCNGHGGHLAKETSWQRYSFLRKELLAETDSLRMCLWIGLTDAGSLGDWRWSDGEKLSGNHSSWGFVDAIPGLTWLLSSVFDCAALCQDGRSTDGLFERTWTKHACYKIFKAICQIDAVAFNGSTTLPKTDATPPPKRTPTRRKRRPISIGKTADRIFELPDSKGVRLTSRPDWSFLTFSASSCARRCQDPKFRCEIFNYNTVSNECNGFSSESVLAQGCETGEDWTIWKRENRRVY